MKRENAAVDDDPVRRADLARICPDVDDMSCADFTAMDSSGQMAAVDKMGGAMKSGDSGAMSSGSATGSRSAGGPIVP